MNAPRLAVAATVLVMLCGTAGADTMGTTKDDPLAVPVSGQPQAGERAADPWTPERLAKAQPKAAGDVDVEAALAAASGRGRSGREGGPAGATAAMIVAADGSAPIGTLSGADGDPNYWTPQRLRAARPMPKPVITPDSLPGPGKKSR